MIRLGSLVSSNRRADSTTRYLRVCDDIIGILPTALCEAGWQLAESYNGYTIAVRVIPGTRHSVRNWSYTQCYDVERRELNSVAEAWEREDGTEGFRIMAALGEALPKGLVRADCIA